MRFLLFILIGTILLKDSLQASSIKYDVDPSKQPIFTTNSIVFRVQENATVVLPCKVANLGPFALVWKKGIAVLSAGEILVSPDSRVTLNPDYSLVIKEIGPQDAGDYICQIGTLEPKEITHTVEITYPPQIHSTTSHGRIEVKKGTNVRLECKASGNPTPKITWTRKNNLLPSGEESKTIESLVLNNVDQHYAGIYQCVAGNGVGKDVADQIILHVLYPPEITVEKPVVHSGEGSEATLVCIVRGEKDPEVLWYRDTMQLYQTENTITGKWGTRHRLTINKVTLHDFGNYSCVAENPLGKTKKTIELTGIPNPVKFISSSISKAKEYYNISWEVQSFSPIEEYKLLYRRLSDVNQAQSFHHQGNKNNERRENTYIYNSKPIKDKRFEWRNVILAAVPSPPSNIQYMSYVIRGLEAGQKYEAIVQARNKHGWSPQSEAFTFNTSFTDEITPDSQHVAENSAIGDVLLSVRDRNNNNNTIKFSVFLIIFSIILPIFFM